MSETARDAMVILCFAAVVVAGIFGGVQCNKNCTDAYRVCVEKGVNPQNCAPCRQ